MCSDRVLTHAHAHASPLRGPDGLGLHGKYYGVVSGSKVYNTWHSQSDTSVSGGTWIEVDLQNDSLVEEIHIYNRSDSSDYSKRLNNFKLVVYKDGVVKYESGLITPDFTATGANKPNGFWTNGAYTNLFKFAVPSQTVGDKVRIVKPSGGVMNFGELEVIGVHMPAGATSRSVSLLDAEEQVLLLQAEEEAEADEEVLAHELADSEEAAAAELLQGGALCEDFDGLLPADA
eukprot:tig00020943_g16259.t1